MLAMDELRRDRTLRVFQLVGNRHSGPTQIMRFSAFLSLASFVIGCAAVSTQQPGSGFAPTTASSAVRQQQAAASRWDPYADVDAGPEIVGGRPRDFARPASEPVRSDGFRDTRWPF